LKNRISALVSASDMYMS